MAASAGSAAGGSPAERRRAERYPLSLPLTEINGRAVGPGYQLVNISTFGAKIETATAFHKDDQVEFAFVPPGRQQLMRRRGKVVWVLPTPLTAGHYYLGLQFSSFEELPPLS